MEVSRIIEEAVEKVRDMLKVRKQALVALTDRLIEVESVDSDELKNIMDENSPGPLLVPGTSFTNVIAKDDDEADANENNDDKQSPDIGAAQ